MYCLTIIMPSANKAGAPHRIVQNLLVLLLSALLPLSTWATETDEVDIKANFANYWSAMSESNFKAAGAYVHPLDLAGLRTEVLPIFLKASDSDIKEVGELAAMFFDEVPLERRSQLSGLELYVLFNNLMNTLAPQIYAVFGEAGREIVEIKLDSPNKASLRYRVLLGDKAVEATQLLGKFNGRWYVNMPQSPKEGAAKFRQAFGQK